MKKIYLLLLVLLMAVMGLHAEKEIYGVYDGTVLTIQYDENRDANGGVTDWWEGQYCGLRDAVTTVEIDASMTDARPTRTKGWFGGFEKLEQINGMENLNTSSTTDMSDMFSTSAKLASIDLSHFDTRNVRSMGGMFMGCESLKVLNLLSFDISSLEDVEAMFGLCSNLETIYCALNWEKSLNITSSQDMFYGCESLKGGRGTVYDEVYVDKSYARPDSEEKPGYFTESAAPTEPEIYGVFDDAAKTMTLYYDKKRLDRKGILEWWNTETDDEDARNEAVETVILNASMKDARPTSTESWFEYFQSLTEIRHLDYLNTEKVEDMYSMFDWCLSLENLDVSHFKTGKVKDMGYMFSGLPVKKLDLSNFDTKNVTNMAGMFGDCPELTELDLRSFDMSKVENTSYMFRGCEKLKTIYCNADISELDGDSSVEMFKWCVSLVGGKGTAYDENNVGAEYARPDEEGKPGYFTSSKQQGLDEISQETKAKSQKLIRNGQLLIERNGKTFNALGTEVK